MSRQTRILKTDIQKLKQNLPTLIFHRTVYVNTVKERSIQSKYKHYQEDIQIRFNHSVFNSEFFSCSFLTNFHQPKVFSIKNVVLFLKYKKGNSFQYRLWYDLIDF